MMSKLEVLSWTFIVLGLLTGALVFADVLAHPQRMRIMNIVWPITGLYFPVVGFWFYRAMGRPMAADSAPMRGERPYWKRIFLSATHCGSGCVIGDVVGAPIIFIAGWTIFGERLFADYAAEFALANMFGIAFQYFPIRAMKKISPGEAVLDAVKADTLSLVAFEVGMFGWMAVVTYVLMAGHPPAPNTVVFWFMMQIGMVLGFMTTYPANWLLVKWGVKSGM